MNTIYLNEILRFEDLNNVKIRFHLMIEDNWSPIDFFRNGEEQVLLKGQYWNNQTRKSFKDGQVTVGFVKIDKKGNNWLLFHVGKITKDLNILDGVGYEFETLDQFKKYFGRLIIRFNNKAQIMVRNANSVIQDCEVVQILPSILGNDMFPGYDKVNISWYELNSVMRNSNWKTALQNQKGVYLITDYSNGKMYVGSAYGEEMIFGRWLAYIQNGHGGNSDLKKLDFEHIKENFKYAILDIYKSTTDDLVIRERESWWKEVLNTRKFGYNNN